MVRYQLLLAPAAKNDLRDIYEYGLRQWGQTQSKSYLSTIKYTSCTWDSVMPAAETRTNFGRERMASMSGLPVYPMAARSLPMS